MLHGVDGCRCQRGMSAHKRESFHRTALTDERPQYDCAWMCASARIGRVIRLHSVCEESLLNSFRHSDPRRLSSRAYLRDDAVHTLIVVVEDKPERGRCTNGYRFIAADYRLELPLADGLLDGPARIGSPLTVRTLVTSPVSESPKEATTSPSIFSSRAWVG